MATITDPAQKHQPLSQGIGNCPTHLASGSAPLWGPSLFLMLSLVSLALSSCSFNLQPAMLVDRIKNRGPVSISTSNPYLVANQYLEYQRENSPEVSQFLASRGSPAALEIQKPFLGEASFFLYYPENGEYYILREGVEGWILGGPYKLSGRKMQQIRDVVKAVPAL